MQQGYVMANKSRTSQQYNSGARGASQYESRPSGSYSDNHGQYHSTRGSFHGTPGRSETGYIHPGNGVPHNPYGVGSQERYPTSTNFHQDRRDNGPARVGFEQDHSHDTRRPPSPYRDTSSSWRPGPSDYPHTSLPRSNLKHPEQSPASDSRSSNVSRNPQDNSRSTAGDEFSDFPLRPNGQARPVPSSNAPQNAGVPYSQTKTWQSPNTRSSYGNMTMQDTTVDTPVQHDTAQMITNFLDAAAGGPDFVHG